MPGEKAESSNNKKKSFASIRNWFYRVLKKYTGFISSNEGDQGGEGAGENLPAATEEKKTPQYSKENYEMLFAECDLFLSKYKGNLLPVFINAREDAKIFFSKVNELEAESLGVVLDHVTEKHASFLVRCMNKDLGGDDFRDKLIEALKYAEPKRAAKFLGPSGCKVWEKIPLDTAVKIVQHCDPKIRGNVLHEMEEGVRIGVLENLDKKNKRLAKKMQKEYIAEKKILDDHDSNVGGCVKHLRKIRIQIPGRHCRDLLKNLP